MGLQQVWLSYNQLFNLLFFFFFLFLCQLTCLHAQLCTQEQTSALLQFKRNFSFNKSASEEAIETCDEYWKITSFPKMESWKKGSDCCSWAGVDCDGTGRVIGLDLSCSWLQGTIHPNSSLFLSFPHLQKLNLAYNNLKLEEGGFELLIQNLSKLRDLDLSEVNMSSSVFPNSLLNLTSLRSLGLGSCGLHGKFPSEIFHLPHLHKLDIWDNKGLSGYLPDFFNLSYPLLYLDLSYTSFSGGLPDSLSNLKVLEVLGLSDSEFYGPISISLWNLTHVTFLDLSVNHLSGILPSSISNLRNLDTLYLSQNNFTGPLSGPLYSWVANLSKLQILDVSDNSLTGPLPSPQVIVSPKLRTLLIGQNLINGTIPSWVFQLPALKYLDLSSNKLIGCTLEFQSSSLRVIDLSNNLLHGTVPNSTFELPNLTQLILSLNNFSGTIPESTRLSQNLTVLELQRNNFSGTIHHSITMPNSLKTVNLNGNGFEGSIPKSLVRCIDLEVLDLGRNKFSDKFPRWLGNLPKLRILILRSNKFHGSILTSPRTKFPFPMLRVFDMSINNFTGPLPIEYFKSFKAMMNVDEVNFRLEYMTTAGMSTEGFDRIVYYNSLNIVYKGSTIEMKKILKVFTAIDLSRNKFQGEIPGIIGGLNSIRGLNLSHNSLTGHIPKSLGNLTKLEWLDLSSNKLTGEIPPQLTNLTFLGTLNLSQNRLTGRIPRGKQFDTFSNDSYVNNSALCGPPSSNTCGNPKATQPPPSRFEEEDSEPVSGFGWEVILPGYGFGLVVGLVMGYLMFSFGKPQWLVETVESVGNRNGKRLKSNARRRGGRRN